MTPSQRRQIGRSIREARRALNMRQLSLAATARIAPHQLSLIERGIARPTDAELERIKNALKAEIELLGEADRPGMDQPEPEEPETESERDGEPGAVVLSRKDVVVKRDGAVVIRGTERSIGRVDKTEVYGVSGQCWGFSPFGPRDWSVSRADAVMRLIDRHNSDLAAPTGAERRALIDAALAEGDL